MPGTFKSLISSGVTGREHAYATSSSIGALSQCDRPAWGLLMDLRRETRFAGTAVTTVVGTTGLPGAGLRATEGAGVNVGVDNVGSAGAGSCVTMVAGAAGLSNAGLSGGIDGIGSSRRRAGISASFSAGGSTLTSASGFALDAVTLGRRFGWEAATRGAFACPGLVVFSCASSVGHNFPRRGTPRGSRQIHFTVPLPPSVRISSFCRDAAAARLSTVSKNQSAWRVLPF